MTMNDEEYDDDPELSPNEITCPFCGQGDACSHFLANFDCTFDGEGNYGIGLGGGAIYDVNLIGDLFKGMANCYARARYKDKESKLPIAPQGAVFSEYVRSLQEVKLDAKRYHSKREHAEDDYCSDFRASISYYGEVVRRTLLEILGILHVDVYEEESFIDGPMISSKYTSWFCSDAKASAAKLEEELAIYLSDFRDKNGLL